MDRLAQYFFPAMALLGGAMMLGILIQAIEASRATDQVCLGLQHSMISGEGGRADAAQAYTALGCRPQWPSPMARLLTKAGL